MQVTGLLGFGPMLFPSAELLETLQERRLSWVQAGFPVNAKEQRVSITVAVVIFFDL